MNEKTYDKIISNENIAETTLALLTNQHAYSARSAGIFTLHDLVNIHKYINFALSLPNSASEVLSWLNISTSDKLPIEKESLTDAIELTRQHAGEWDSIEQQVKEQSINLSLISRNITQTGNQILDYINHMPVIQQISNILQELSIEKLTKLYYKSDDQQIATELLSILKLIKDDIQVQRHKTAKVKHVISDFRIRIIGGNLSSHQHVESLLFRIKSIYMQLDAHNDNNSDEDSYLTNKIENLKKEVHKLEQEYNHFVKLSFTGLVGGLIGLIITGGIFGSQAEKIRKQKNVLLEEIADLNNQVNKNRFIKKIFSVFKYSSSKLKVILKMLA
ncbi:alpha-xenorhabdolysin family binary toxin subunit A [Providencia sneebia]|uniref:alpha-xenorhabdolysin family binary toxin subunit A n=1 Tax=Providencia sneebia TaxID=516075 RepID=UPI0002FAE3F4|nr:alpha-xenorhabdolysin family binary toxin subunit A [Providencia sneebia]